ncbi:hypothetical protein F5880DRAFT_1216760 [Lentinula raphanica]|nr:hypothetical protein F5880DRAFT_1216760 [Lentinula raphanica]
MSSTADPEHDIGCSKTMMQEMLELMRDTRDILSKWHKEHEETDACKNGPPSKFPAQENIREAEEATGATETLEIVDNSPAKPTALPTKFFGLKKEQARHTNPLAATYDYRIKYPQDERYHEHDPEARIWWVYNDEAAAFDNDMIGEFGDSLDILLVFAGLFSAVVTTFIVQTSQALSVDNASLSASYLEEISTILRASGNITLISQIPSTNTTFSPASGDIWVNGLWFTSLTVALSVALFAVLAKQWLRQYMSIVTGTPRERAFIRQFRFDGLKTWKVQAIISILPVLLHLSLVLFLIGLVIFLIPLNTSIAYVTGVITVVIIVSYLAATFLPLYIVQCPYRTIFSDLLYYISRPLRVSYYRLRYFVCWIYQSLRSKTSWQQQYSATSMSDGNAGFTTLKDVERHAACHTKEPHFRLYDKDHQDLIYNALWWLGESTTNISAKEIIFLSLGAFSPRMTYKLCTKDALQVLFGSKTYTALLDLTNLDDHATHPEIFRSMIHLAGAELRFNDHFGNQMKGMPPESMPEFTTSTWNIQLALAFWASNIPMKLNVPSFNQHGPRYIPPSEGLSWIVENYFKVNPAIEVTVPPLVWKGLFEASSNQKFREAFQAEVLLHPWDLEGSSPVLCFVPIEDLVKLADEGLNEVPRSIEPAVDDWLEKEETPELDLVEEDRKASPGRMIISVENAVVVDQHTPVISVSGHGMSESDVDGIDSVQHSDLYYGPQQDPTMYPTYAAEHQRSGL